MFDLSLKKRYPHNILTYGSGDTIFGIHSRNIFQSKQYWFLIFILKLLLFIFITISRQELNYIICMICRSYQIL